MHVGYMSHMSYVSHEYFHESLKTTCFLFLKSLKVFCYIEG